MIRHVKTEQSLLFDRPFDHLTLQKITQWVKLIWLTGCFRNVAGYRAYHVTYQPKICSVNSRFRIGSNIVLTFWTNQKPINIRSKS